MSLLGLEVNATRLRAVRGPVGDYPCIEPLDAPRADLPLVLLLEGRAAVVGRAGLGVCRKAPQQALLNFLPRLGEPPLPPRRGERPRPEASRALALAFQHVVRACRENTGVVLALPAYLAARQVEQALTTADTAGLPVLGSVCTPLAVALAAHAEQAWFGTAVIVDVDDQALTVATVSDAEGHARLLDLRCLPMLGLRVWRERLLNALADCCILDSRWDPRESPQAEQLLFDQLDEVLDAAQTGRMAKVTVQAAKRFQTLVLQPQDPVAFCAALRRQAAAEVQHIFTAPWPGGGPGGVLLTAAAARLPGLVAALQIGVAAWCAAAPAKPRSSLSTLEDFGSGLLDDEAAEPGSVVVLTPDAAARGAHSVAPYFQRGDIASGHLHDAAPLPLPQPLEAGPARLHYQGQDYLLGAGKFQIGRQAGLDLVFDAEHWPGVSARHCEIVYERRCHMLCDRSREGTLVNDRPATQPVPLRPGDWIRLGPSGPLLRFLGQSADLRTTA